MAIKYYTMAAEKGNPAAQNNLGSIYRRGEGTPVDYEKAAQFYAMAAPSVDIAKANLAYLHRYGLGVEKSNAKAFELYSEAAKNGFAPAIFELGRLYEKGRGAEKSMDQAVELYRHALALDDALFDVERRVAELEETLAEAEDGEAEDGEAEDSESDESEWEPEWEAEQEEVDAGAAAIDPELGLRSAEHAMKRAQHNRELLRRLAREEIEAQGGDPDLVERAEQVPFDEGR